MTVAVAQRQRVKPESVLTLLPMPLLQIRTFPPPLCTLRARPLSISATLMDTTLPPVLVDQVPPQVIKCIYVTIVAVCVLTLLSDCWCKASLKHCSASLLSSMARSSRQMCIPHHIHPPNLIVPCKLSRWECTWSLYSLVFSLDWMESLHQIIVLFSVPGPNTDCNSTCKSTKDCNGREASRMSYSSRMGTLPIGTGTYMFISFE